MMEIIKRELVRTDPAGFEVWSETYRMGMIVATDMREDPDSEDETVSELIEQLEGASGQISTHEVTYTTAGKYIGTVNLAKMLCEKRGIAPETLTPDGEVCCIGFSKKDQKWYGWSHRAIYGFSVGDVVEDGDCCASSGYTAEYLAEHPGEDMSLPVGFKAKTIADTKRMAVAFAESVD